MNELPPEIAVFVCNRIEQADVPRLRLVSRFWNDVASAYLLRKPKLIFKQDSFDHLRDISEHPFFSKLVTRLVYEPNTLNKTNRASWERSICMKKFVAQFPAHPGSYASERDLRLWNRNCGKVIRKQKPYIMEELDKGWDIYQKYYKEQSSLKERDYGLIELSDTLKNLPNLRKISMNHSRGLWLGAGYSTDEKTNLYAQALASAGSGKPGPHPCGVPQMRSLLVAISQANIQLQTLRIGTVSWKFLKMKPQILEKMKEVLSSVQRFEIQISTGYYSEGEEIGVEIPECRDYLENNAMHDILSAASELDVLSIGFDSAYPFPPANLENIFQSTRWPILIHLTLECIETSEEAWMAFLDRHVSTLRFMMLCSIELSHGAWPDVLERMKSSLKLKSVAFQCQISGTDPQQFWDLDVGECPRDKDMISQGHRTRKALEDYFVHGVHGGTCPLRDSDAYPNLAFAE